LKKYKLYYACFFLFYFIFPWEDISRQGFSDTDTYIYTFDNFNILSKLNFSINSFLDSEILFIHLVTFLNQLSNSTKISLNIIILFVLLIWFNFLTKHKIKITSTIILMLNPFVINAVFSSVKNLLAYGVILLFFNFYNYKIFKKEIISIVFAISIHFSSIIFLLLKSINRLNILKKTSLIALLPGLFLFIIIVPFNKGLSKIYPILSSDNFFSESFNFYRSVIWYIYIGIFLFLESQEKCIKHIYTINIVFLSILLSFYIPSIWRLWACIFPMIIYSIDDFKPSNKRIFLFLWFINSFVEFLYWSILYEIL